MDKDLSQVGSESKANSHRTVSRDRKFRDLSSEPKIKIDEPSTEKTVKPLNRREAMQDFLPQTGRWLADFLRKFNQG